MLTLTWPNEAMARVEIELGSMVAASQEVAVLIQKLSRARIEPHAVMGTGVLKPEIAVAFVCHQNWPGLSRSRFLLTHKHETGRLAIGNIRRSTNCKQFRHGSCTSVRVRSCAYSSTDASGVP
jgi:hypothetical protein